MEDNHGVFWHFVVQRRRSVVRVGGHQSRSREVILVVGCEEDTWQWIGEFGR
jgi:hypothetical protein